MSNEFCINQEVYQELSGIFYVEDFIQEADNFWKHKNIKQ